MESVYENFHKISWEEFISMYGSFKNKRRTTNLKDFLYNRRTEERQEVRVCLIGTRLFFTLSSPCGFYVSFLDLENREWICRVDTCHWASYDTKESRRCAEGFLELFGDMI